MDKAIRIAKYLAHQGYGSRRAIELWVDEGKVAVNGGIIKDKGHKVIPGKDVIAIDGEEIEAQGEFVYYALNKPVGVLSTTKDSQRRRTVVDLVRDRIGSRRVYPVGRLDLDSEGLILLTNDGELTHKLTHPKFHIPKKYRVCVQGEVLRWKLDKLRSGVRLRDGVTSPAEVKIVQPMRNRTWLEFVISEGRHRQIRRMCGAVKLSVIQLVRVEFGPVKLERLPSGQMRVLGEDEVEVLRRAVEERGEKMETGS